MKALIIGVAGFVGKYLSDELARAGWEVYGTKLSHEAATPDIPVLDLDILDVDAIKDVLKQVNPDHIFHLAAQSSVAVSWKQPALTVDVNIKGALNLLEAVREMDKAPRVLLIGSGDEYGYILPEELPLSEAGTLRPGNVYACSKIAQGMLGQVYAKAYGLEIIIVRAFNHIGPGQTDTFVVPSFCKQVAEIEATGSVGTMRVGNLDAKRDFTDVRDIVRAYRMLAQKGESGEVYNVGSGKAIAIAEILKMILSQSNATINAEQDPERMRPSDVPIIEPDISKIMACTGWKPEIPMEKTIADILNDWRGK